MVINIIAISLFIYTFIFSILCLTRIIPFNLIPLGILGLMFVLIFSVIINDKIYKKN